MVLKFCKVTWRIVEATLRFSQSPQGRMEAASMPTIVDFPMIVQEGLMVFGEVFDIEAARHFAEYLTGLKLRHLSWHDLCMMEGKTICVRASV